MKKSKFIFSRAVIFSIMVMILSNCTTTQHSGTAIPDETPAKIALQNGSLVIAKIDEETIDQPNPTKSFLIGGGYFGAVKALTAKAELQPGAHVLLVKHTNCVSGGSAIVNFVAEADHKYRINGTIGKAIGHYKTSSFVGKKEIVTEFTDVMEYPLNIYVEDITNKDAPKSVGEAMTKVALKN